MNLDIFLKRNIVDVFIEIKSSFNVIEYSKVEETEFVVAKEYGFFLKSNREFKGDIDTYRIYLKEYDGYSKFIDDKSYVSHNYVNKDNLFSVLGEPLKIIPSINISKNRPATLLGWCYVKNEKRIIYNFNENDEIVYFTVSLFV